MTDPHLTELKAIRSLLTILVVLACGLAGLGALYVVGQVMDAVG